MAGRRGPGILTKLLEGLEMPPDAFLNLSRVTVIGGIQLHLTNHVGVREYTRERIRVAVNGGEIVIDGANLKIASIYGSELVVDGQIDSLEFVNGE